MSDKTLCKTCPFCEGAGTVPTGIEEAPEASCRRCDGEGHTYEPAPSPAMNAASQPKLYRKADINAEIAQAFLYTENGAIGLMLLDEQGSATSGEAAPVPCGAVSELAAFQQWAVEFDGPINPISAWEARAALAAKAEQANTPVPRAGLTPVQAAAEEMLALLRAIEYPPLDGDIETLIARIDAKSTECNNLPERLAATVAERAAPSEIIRQYRLKGEYAWWDIAPAVELSSFNAKDYDLRTVLATPAPTAGESSAQPGGAA